MVATRRTSRQKTPVYEESVSKAAGKKKVAPQSIAGKEKISQKKVSAEPAASPTPEPSKKRSLPAEDEKSPVPPPKRSRDESTPPTNGVAAQQRYPSPADQGATEHDKETWQGFCEIASEPEFFSVMLREMGVNSVCARQVFFPDLDTLKQLPQPIYGFVFLLRYREFDSENQSEDCPDGVWFANQLPAQNSCSTLAMFHVLMNTPDIQLGENLQEFKSFTSEMHPLHRGESLANFEFVKRIHNSFATKMDLLVSDSIAAQKCRKAEKAKAKGDRKQSVTSISSEESIEDSAHHYLAFLPIDGQVWKLDGMNAQPTSLGEYDEENTDEWLDIACKRIMALMATAGDEDYQLFALVRAPLARHRQEMCEMVKTAKLIESTLDKQSPEWKSFLVADGENPVAPGPPSPSLLSSFGISEEQLNATTIDDDERQKIEKSETSVLLGRRERLMLRINEVQDSIMMEMGLEADEKQKADERRWDYAPVARVWLEMLAENGWLQKNIAKFKDPQ
ncbi:cysteine proteinase [Lophiostoma macrostomum CBS 122681]|uniref:ubiquitinyl hydrolase 1 n=1 Tax=Lophiostoma macrostomum CBS 122681 TaxID=1314788 RepID=A0A6A6SNP8_9PLEO|nr:cysteine proteinase [Lophiostoma macrostomum CBS 122681]